MITVLVAVLATLGTLQMVRSLARWFRSAHGSIRRHARAYRILRSSERVSGMLANVGETSTRVWSPPASLTWDRLGNDRFVP